MRNYCLYCFGKNIEENDENFSCLDCGKSFAKTKGEQSYLASTKKVSIINQYIGLSESFSSDLTDFSKSQLKNTLNILESNQTIDSNANDSNGLSELIADLKDALVRLTPERATTSQTPSNLTTQGLLNFLLENAGLSGIYSAGAKLRSLVERQLKAKYGFISFSKQNKIGLEKHEFIKIFKDYHHKTPKIKDDYLEYYDEESQKTYVSMNNILKFFKVFKNRNKARKAASINRTLNLFIHESKENDETIKTLFPSTEAIKKFILESYAFYRDGGLIVE